MKTKTLPLFGLVAALLITGCGQKSESSSKEDKSSKLPESSQVSSAAASSSQNQSSKASSQTHKVHSWTAGAKQGLVYPETCSCGLTAFRMQIAEASGWNSTSKFNERSNASKMAATWDITGKIPAGKYAIQVAAKVSQDSHSDRYWYNMAIKGNETRSSNDNPDTTSEAPFRYFFKVDGTTVNPTNEKSWGEDGLNASSFTDVILVDSIELKGNEKSFSLNHGDIGFSVGFEYVRLINLDGQGGGQGGNTSSSVTSSSVSPETRHDGEQKAHVGAAPANTSQQSDICKSYLDAMAAQHETISDDYKINDLKGNSGVDIRKYYDTSKVREEKSDRSKGVNVTFTVDKGFEARSYKIKYSTNSDFSGALECDANPEGTTLKNLFSGTKYYYKVEGSNGIISDVGNFTTGNYTRWIDAYELYNVRDMGGYMTSSGKRVKQGLIYRGGEITTKEWGSDHAKTYSENSKRIFRDVMGIKVEIDLRNQQQAADGCNSCWFAENGDIKFQRTYLESYAKTLNNYTSQIKQVFDTFANADKEPVYYHCHGGADRTGTIGWLLLGVLGCSYTDMVIDFELTSYSSIKGGDCHRSHMTKDGMYDDYPGLVNAMKGKDCYDANKSIKDNFEAFLTKKCGVSTTTINKIRDIMIEK